MKRGEVIASVATLVTLALVTYTVMVALSLNRCLRIHKSTGRDVRWTFTTGCEVYQNGQWAKR